MNKHRISTISKSHTLGWERVVVLSRAFRSAESVKHSSSSLMLMRGACGSFEPTTDMISMSLKRIQRVFIEDPPNALKLHGRITHLMVVRGIQTLRPAKVVQNTTGNCDILHPGKGKIALPQNRKRAQQVPEGNLDDDSLRANHLGEVHEVRHLVLLVIVRLVAFLEMSLEVVEGVHTGGCEEVRMEHEASITEKHVVIRDREEFAIIDGLIELAKESSRFGHLGRCCIASFRA
jgi:hypothetical protein